ncbi:MAG: TRAP transporter small permease [Pseudomonadota bacterium]
MSSSTVLADDSRLSWFDRALLRIESTLNLLGGITIIALVVLAVVHVGGRKLFNAPVHGYVDWIEQFMIVFAFFGLSYCQREGGHIRMDILVGKLKGRALWLAEWVSVVFMAILTLGLIYGTWHHFLRSFDWGAPLFSRDSTIDIGLPIWPAKLIVPVMLTIFGLRLMLQIIGYWRALRRAEARPVAVPLPDDPMAQAAREADAVSGKD